ncbi:peptide ABC transporter permease, partial [Burkholderia pseudomallei]
QTSHEEQADLSRTRHIVLDEALLLQRADELGLNYRDDVVVSLVIDSLTHTLPHVTVHRTKGAFDDMLRDYIDDIVLNHDETVGQMAMSNGSLGEVYLPFETLLEDIPYDDVKEFSIIGHVGMTPDVERPYVGHIVHVSASLFLTRYGRFCVGEPQCRVNAAKLAWLGDDGSEGEQPTTPLANALAEELGIEREDAEALADAEILPNESND